MQEAAAAATRARQQATVEALASQEAAARALAERDLAVARVKELEGKGGRKRERLKRWLARLWEGMSEGGD